MGDGASFSTPSARRVSTTRAKLGHVRMSSCGQALEIGFGPGLAIAELAGLAGRVHGIDHSAAMVRRATRRNSRAIRDGRVRLVHASVDRLPEFGEQLDVIMAVNSAKFWAEPAARLRDLRRLLRPSGRIALAIQPRCPGADGATTAQAAREHHDLLAVNPG